MRESLWRQRVHWSMAGTQEDACDKQCNADIINGRNDVGEERVYSTRLPSNLRQDHPANACIYCSYACSLPVTWQRWCSHRSIRHGGKVENPMLHANFMALCFTERELLPKFYIARIGIVDFYISCDLNLDPMTFIFEPVFPGDIPHMWKWTSYVHSLESYLLTYIHTYIQIYIQDRKLYTT